MNVRWRIGALLVASALAGGSGCSTENPGGDESTDLSINGQWRLMLAVIDGSPLKTPDGADLTLVVSGDGNQAQAGCTVLAFEPQVEGQSVELREVSRGGMMSCLPNTPEGSFNDEYLDALSSVTEGERVGSRLTLRGSGVTLSYASVVN